MLAIGQNVDALFLAPRLSGGATYDTRTIVARRTGTLRGGTRRSATPAMLRVTRQIHARSVTIGVTRHTRETTVTGLALTGSERRGHANPTTPAAVVDVAVGVDARTGAIRGAQRTLRFTSASQTHFVDSAGMVTVPAMREIRREVDTGARTFDRAGSASALALPNDAADSAAGRCLAGVGARPTMVHPRVGVHTLAIALRQARVASYLAAPVLADGLGVSRRGTALFARAAVLRIGFCVDANACAVELARRTFCLARARGTDVAPGAAMATGSTVSPVGGDVDASAVTRHEAGFAYEATRA